jgi:thioredoxin reductase
MNRQQLPVAVIGAGPIGLAAAARLIERGETPLVLEAGSTVGASVRHWGHVRMFSPWRSNIDPAARALLERSDWQAPDPDQLPTGRELVQRYLEPLAALPQIAPHLHLGTRVSAITRQGFDKLKTDGREHAPFVLHVNTSQGNEQVLLAKAVIDASGTYTSPNPLGGSGVPASGEAALSERIFYGIPDVLGQQRARYAGRKVLVVGNGHSAFNVLLDLAQLASQVDGTQITWAIRRADPERVFGGGSADQLPARGELGVRMRQLIERGVIRLITNFQTTQLRTTGDAITVEGASTTIAPMDEIVATTGFRPDLALLRELRIGLDPLVESPTALAELIDPNVHSCGTVPPHGAKQLEHPEPDFYIVGMKSYGRAPTFLLLTGYEQVRSVVAAIVGDLDAAQDVRLVLPATGACSASPPATAGAALGETPVLVGSGASAVCCG